MLLPEGQAAGGHPHGEFAALGMFLHRQKTKTDPAQHLQLQLLG